MMHLNHQVKEKLTSGLPPTNQPQSSVSVLKPPPNRHQSSPLVLRTTQNRHQSSVSVQSTSQYSGSNGGAAADEVEQACEYLKLQEKNILEKQKKLKEMEIPASLPKKKPRRKRTKPKASDVVPRKSARFASKVNQDQDQEAAESPAVVDQEAAESPAAGGQETAAAESPDVGQEAAVSPAAADQ